MEKKKILIVDDDPATLKTTGYALECAGYEVQTAADGEEALKKLEEANPDLILLDLILPLQGGFQVAKAIKSIERYKDTPIIVLSCKKEYAAKRTAARSGIIEYIEKPFDMDKLLFHIKNALG